MGAVLTVLLVVFFVVAILCPALPVFLHFVTPSFPYDGVAAVGLALIVAERVWAMFFRMRERTREKAQQDWTSAAVAYGYAAVLYVSILDLFLRRHGLPPWPVLLIGMSIYAAGVALRYWAFAHLRHQWSVQIDKDMGDRRLITDGPYSLVRHPLYLGALMESVGFPLIAGSAAGLVVALVCFFPFEIYRGYFEEQFLNEIFGNEYTRYKSRTRGFLPWPKGRSRHSAVR